MNGEFTRGNYRRGREAPRVPGRGSFFVLVTEDCFRDGVVGELGEKNVVEGKCFLEPCVAPAEYLFNSTGSLPLSPVRTLAQVLYLAPPRAPGLKSNGTTSLGVGFPR